MPAPPLQNITFIAGELPPVPAELLGTPRGEVWGNYNAAAQASINYAQELGATIVSSVKADEKNIDGWLLFANGDASLAVAAEAEMLQQAPDIPAVKSRPFVECSSSKLRKQLGQGESFLLSYRAVSMGHCKYLIRTEEQLDTFLHFLDTYQDESDPKSDYARLFHVRDFIDTPSNHYTSYRTLTTPSGDTIAAVLHYSSHTKETTKITHDNRVINTSTFLDTIKTSLENPASPFYLNAPDIRSNVSVTGKTIPLMGGDNARPITDYERSILEAHGIDPYDPRPPQVLLDTAARIGPLIGPKLDLVIGLDFLQKNTPDTIPYLEANASPGDIAFRECWQPGAHSAESMTAMRKLALDTIAVPRYL